VFFTGQTLLTIDAKLRLAIPAKYRHQWKPSRDGEAWYCMPWPTGHLRLYTEAKFMEMAGRRDDTLTPGQADDDLESLMFGFAERIEEDKAGRITIPKQHLELAGIGTDVVMVGARVRLEVHGRAAWEAEAKERLRRLPELIEAVRLRRNGGVES
jgi:MraZ protein